MRLVKKIIHSLLSRLVGYYDGTLKAFSETESGYQLVQGKSSFPVVILSRDFYSEKQKFYPVESEKELQKIINFERTDNELYLPIHDPDKQGYNVHFWTLADSLDLSAHYVIPETLLLAGSLEEQNVYHVSTGSTNYFIAKHKTGFFSAKRNQLLATAALFATAVGVAAGKEVEIEQQNFISALINGFKTASVRWFSYLKNPRQQSVLDIKPYVLTTAIGTVLYLCVSSLYLIQQEKITNEQLAEIGDRVNVVMDKNAHLESLANELGQQSELVTEHHLTSYLWQVLTPIYQTDNRLTQIRLLNGRYVIRGEGPKATEVLTLLIEHPYVVEAKFDTSVIKRSKKERFIISFTVNVTKDKAA